MKKLIMGSLLVAVAMSMVGCRSTNVDEWRSDLKTQLCPARFKPVYEVMKDKGIVKGEAKEEYSWWGFVGTRPDTFANEIGGPISFGVGVKEAAFQDACAKSGATILLAPRFTVYKERGVFNFNGVTKVTVEGVPAKLTGAEEVVCPPPCAKAACCCAAKKACCPAKKACCPTKKACCPKAQ